MSGVARQNLPADLAAYANSWEHISAELRCLDLRLRQQVLAQSHTQASDPLSPFKGLVITDAEIAELLAHGESARTDPRSVEEQQKLEQGLAELQDEIEARRAASHKAGVYLSLSRLTELFALTPFEEQCLIICLAPEVDRKYEKLYAYLQDDATRKKPGVDLVLNLLCANQGQKLLARTVFDPYATLLKFKLLQMTDGGSDGQVPLLSRTLKLDDRIVNFLLGYPQMDARLERFARMVLPHDGVEEMIAAQDIYQQANNFVQAYFREPHSMGRNLVLYLHGPANMDKRWVVEAICRNYKLPLLIADVEAMKAGQLPFEQTTWLLAREAALQSAVLCLENTDCLLGEPEKHLLELNALIEGAKTFSRLTFMFGSRHWQPQGFTRECLFLTIAVPRPDLATCKRLWEQSLAGRERLAKDVDTTVLAGKFRLGLSQIKDAVMAAENLARWRSPEKWEITASDLSAACRAQSSPKLGALAHKMEPKYTWDEIVLPQDNLSQLKELCAQARYRHLVYGEWGFERKLSLGKGLNALFSGPPGTGKTMAAEVIAHELQLDLYRIDLSQVVSKYIGETEKNLHQIFQEAQTGHAILFFDEADALFGKRSEVKDAHDRYANIEVGYLLQKMEEYEGVAILATNLSQHIDEAFLRRMHFIVEFPFPDHEYRRQIWQVVFPREAPLAKEVDFDALAREIRLAGGNIKNIALSAAFYAASNGRMIQMAHLWQAARREHQKLGRTWEGVKVNS
jgi:winged helix domain-containing protein/ATPase family protein associated with various cellular activities (AAA)